MADQSASLRACDTMAKLLLRNAETRAEHPAYREKDYGIWQSWNWRQTAVEVRAFACGLAALGLGRGDKVALIGSNRPQLYWAFDALQSFGGVAVPLYADSVAEEMRFVLEHAEVRFAICEDQEQVDKVLSQKQHLPHLVAIVYCNPRGLRHYDQPFLHSLAKVQELGRALDKERPDAFLAAVAQGKGADVGLIAYTSGTTGNPKGVMLNFESMVRSARLSCELEGLGEDEEMLAYLPLAWVGDYFYSVAQHHWAGFTLNCPESADTVMLDLKDIGPTHFLAPPAIFESFLTQIHVRIADAIWLKRKLFDALMAVAGRSGVALLEGRPVGPIDRLALLLGELLVYGPLKNNLGLSRIRRAYTGGAPLGDEVFNFYRGIGINLKQLYGQTECFAYCTLQRDGDVRSDTVGPPCPEVEIRIANDGEVLYRSPGNFVGYYKQESLTREALDPEGWVHTGDAGFLDARGHLKIIDRAKDVGKLHDGTLFAPQYIENKLKFFSYVKEAVVHGLDREFVGCFVIVDLQAVGNWAEKRGLTYASYQHLSALEPVGGLIKGCIEQVNRSLAKDKALSGSQIKRFILLHKELDADDGELTRTRKVRRSTIAERYKPLIDALYAGARKASIESQVRFENGKVGTLKAELNIHDAETFPAAGGTATPAPLGKAA